MSENCLYLHINVRNSTIYTSPKVETTQMCISGKMDKQIMVYTYNGILSSHKKKWNTYIWINLENILTSESQT